MDKIKHSILFKAIAITLIATFISLDVSWANPDGFRASNSTLATPSVLQENPVNEQAARFRQSVLSRGELLGSVCSIGKYLLEDKLPLKHLEQVMLVELGAAAAGIDLSRIAVKDNVAYIPYVSVCKKSVIQVALRGQINPSARLAGYDWLISGKYLVKELPEDYKPPAPQAKPAIKDEPTVTITADHVAQVAAPETRTQQAAGFKRRSFSVRAIGYLVTTAILGFTSKLFGGDADQLSSMDTYIAFGQGFCYLALGLAAFVVMSAILEKLIDKGKLPSLTDPLPAAFIITVLAVTAPSMGEIAYEHPIIAIFALVAAINAAVLYVWRAEYPLNYHLFWFRHGIFHEKHQKELINIGAPAVAPLIKMLKDRKGRVRVGAAYILSEIGDERAIGPIAEELSIETSDTNCDSLAGFLAKMGIAAEPYLIRILDHGTNRARFFAAYGLGKLNRPGGLEPLIDAASNSSDHKVRIGAIIALRKMIKYPRAVEALIKELGDADSEIRLWTAKALLKSQDRFLTPMRQYLQVIADSGYGAHYKPLTDEELAYVSECFKNGKDISVTFSPYAGWEFYSDMNGNVGCKKVVVPPHSTIEDIRSGLGKIESKPIYDKRIQEVADSAGYEVSATAPNYITEGMAQEVLAKIKAGVDYAIINYSPDIIPDRLFLKRKGSIAVLTIDMSGAQPTTPEKLSRNRQGPESGMSVNKPVIVAGSVVTFAVATPFIVAFATAYPMIAGIGILGAVAVVSLVIWRVNDPLSWNLYWLEHGQSRKHEEEILKIGEPAVPRLIEWFNGNDQFLREYAADILAHMGNHAATVFLLEKLSGSRAADTILVARALGDAQNKLAVKELIYILRNNKDADVRSEAAKALGKIKDTLTVQALQDALYDMDRRVHDNALAALRAMGFRQGARDQHALHLDDIREAAVKEIQSRGELSPKEMFAIVLSNVPDTMSTLRNALEELRPLSEEASVNDERISLAIDEAGKGRGLSRDEVNILRLALMGPGQGIGAVAESIAIASKTNDIADSLEASLGNIMRGLGCDEKAVAHSANVVANFNAFLKRDWDRLYAVYKDELRPTRGEFNEMMEEALALYNKLSVLERIELRFAVIFHDIGLRVGDKDTARRRKAEAQHVKDLLVKEGVSQIMAQGVYMIKESYGINDDIGFSFLPKDAQGMMIGLRDQITIMSCINLTDTRSGNQLTPKVFRDEVGATNPFTIQKLSEGNNLFEYRLKSLFTPRFIVTNGFLRPMTDEQFARLNNMPSMVEIEWSTHIVISDFMVWRKLAETDFDKFLRLVEDAATASVIYIRDTGADRTEIKVVNGEIQVVAEEKKAENAGQAETAAAEIFKMVEAASNAESIKKTPEQVEADNGVGNLIILARRAKRENQKLIIGLETDWIPGIGMRSSLDGSVMTVLMAEMERIAGKLRSMGLDNVEIIRGSGDNIAGEVLKMAKDTNTSLRNVVVMASKNTIKTKFLPLSNADENNRPFLAVIDTAQISDYIEFLMDFRKDINQHLYVRLAQLFYMTLELAAGKQPPDLPIIASYDPKMRIVVFLPKAEVKDYEEIRRLYKAEATALAAA